MVSKKQRHEKILELVRTQAIERQEDLARRLQDMGITVTQATVSRDIHDLQLVKQTAADGRQRYAAAERGVDGEFSRKLSGIFAHSVISVDYANNIVVIKTLSGAAQAAASAVDALHSPHIVGCIAGDDTIFVVVRTQEDAVAISGKLEQMRG